MYDVGYDNGQLFYVMRYMTGGSLSERINEDKRDLDQVSYILLRLADALDYAPARASSTATSNPPTSFSTKWATPSYPTLASPNFEGRRRVTHTGMIGTPVSSPEQARGVETDGRSDQ